MSWFSKISELHVKLATLFEKIDNLSDNVSNLASDLKATVFKVGKLEGALVNSNNPEVLRQLLEISSRLADMEARLQQLEGQKAAEPEEKILKQISSSKN